MSLEIEKIKTNLVRRMRMVEEKPIQEYKYRVDGRFFDSEEKAKDHIKNTLEIRDKIGYREVDEDLKGYMTLYNCHCDSYSKEAFWCFINKKETIDIVKQYLIDRYGSQTKMKVEQIKGLETGWNYVSFVDWDDGDYDHLEESWDVLIKSQNNIIEDIYKMLKTFPDYKDNRFLKLKK